MNSHERPSAHQRLARCTRSGFAFGLACLAMALLPGGVVHAQAPRVFQWAVSAGGDEADIGSGIALDAQGNSYVTGSFTSYAFFEGTGVSNPGQTVFVSKYDSRGALVWVRAASGTLASHGAGIAVDPSGDVVVTGWYTGDMTLGTVSLPVAPAPRPFLAKLNAEGGTVWVRSGLATIGLAKSSAVAVDRSGRIHVAGFFNFRVTFGNAVLDTAGGYDVFHVNYDGAGNVLWAKQGGGAGNDFAYGVAVDGAGNSVVTGTFNSAPAAFGVRTLSTAGNFDMFVAKYDPNGQVLWARPGGGPLGADSSAEAGQGIVADAQGNFIVVGCFQSAPGSPAVFGNIALTSSGAGDMFIAKYNSQGGPVWARRAGGSANDCASAVTVDPAGNCYVLGHFQLAADFGDTQLVSQGQRDIAIIKCDPGGNVLWAKGSGSDSWENPLGIAIDPTGNLHLTGQFTESSQFEAFRLFGHLTEIFVAKLLPSVIEGAYILIEPKDAAVQVGDAARFSVVADASGPLSYQWRFNLTPLPDKTNNVLVIENVQPADLGTYSVVVSALSGSVTSRLASLSLGVSPLIATSPTRQSALVGSTVTFTVAAEGTPPLRYQWLLEDAALPRATNATLTIPNAQASNSGNYRVLVSNAFGSVSSTPARLILRYPLQLSTEGPGTVTRVPELVAYSEETPLALTAVGAPGFALGFWSGDVSGNDNPLLLTITNHTSVVAHFVPAGIAIAIQGQGTVSRSPDKQIYTTGEQVLLLATSARWFQFAGWGDGSRANPRTVTVGPTAIYTAIFSPTTAVETITFNGVSRVAPVGMPSVFVDGQFVATGGVQRVDHAGVSLVTSFPNGTIFYTLDGSPPSFFSTLYDGPITVSRSSTIRALAFDAEFAGSWEADPVRVNITPTYNLDATTPGGGNVAVTPSVAPYLSNALVSVSANPAPGWTFLQWLGDLAGTNPQLSLRVTGDRCASALFGTSLRTTVAGSGTVLIDPVAPLYPYGTVVRLTAIPAEGQGFAAWGNAASGTENPIYFVVTNATPSVSCLFGPLNAGQFSLVTRVEGRGRVTSSPRGNRFNTLQTVTLTAMPEADQAFLGWSGDAGGQQTNLSVVMNQNRIVTAMFTKRPRFLLGPCQGGLTEGGVRWSLSGELGGTYRVERSPNLSDWSPWITFTNVSGITQFKDTETGADAQRFHRAVSLP